MHDVQRMTSTSSRDGCITELGVFPAALNGTFEQFEVFHMTSSKIQTKLFSFHLTEVLGQLKTYIFTNLPLEGFFFE